MVLSLGCGAGVQAIAERYAKPVYAGLDTEFIGILLRSSNTEVFRDLTGQEKSFPKTDVVERTELRTSLMPPGLVSMLTDRELRDLLAFLAKGG